MKYCNVFGLINDSLEVRAEYKRRHDEIWPEMLELIHNSGLKNYSIWNVGDKLIEYYECDIPEEERKAKPKTEVKLRWDEYMSDILVYNPDGTSTPLELMFDVK